jgi:HD superfamily phosphohydrolase
MALAQLVYPGATHTRLHHSLGAYHLMCNAISELRSKGVGITEQEEIAVKAAILLHDVGHGPFSHALENVIIQDLHHEELSLMIMQQMNKELNGALDLTIDIFTNKYDKPFLHQLISGQLDVDRMDYLTRDSFYSGVSEGVIGYDRIIKMLCVHNNQLVVEEKGIYSVEKFLVARRQMYWQVYLHKTVLSAEMMLVKIMQRVKEIFSATDELLKTNSALDFFLSGYSNNDQLVILDNFCSLDDHDVMHAVKVWSKHPDMVLSTLCKNLLKRVLYKTKFQAEAFSEELVKEKIEAAIKTHHLSKEEAGYFVFTGEASNTTYQKADENINILFKDGSTKDIMSIDNALISQNLSTPVKKFYICSLT